jgi:hypothetical protein
MGEDKKADAVRTKTVEVLTIRQTLVRFVKTFGVGASKGFLGVVYTKAIFNFCLRTLPTVPALLMLNRKAWGSFFPRLFRDCIPIGVSTGVVIGLFQGFLKVLEGVQLGAYQKYKAALAVLLSSPGLMFMPTEWNEWLSTTAFLRALEIAAKRLTERGYLPAVENADLYVMMVASLLVVQAYVYYPLSMGASYLAFFNVFFQQHTVAAGQFRRLIKGRNLDPEALDALRFAGNVDGFKGLTKVPFPRTLVTPGQYDRSSLTWRNVMHPQFGSLYFAVRFFIKGWLQGLVFYAPIFLMPRMLFNPMSLVLKPVELLKKLFPDVANSAFFLTTYCTSAFISVPLLRYFGFNETHLPGYGGYLTVVGAGITAAFPLLIERPSRRLEMAEFVFQKGATSVWERFYKHRFTEKTLQRAWFVLMTGSVSYMAHAFYNYPHAMRPMYQAMMGGFTGKFVERKKRKADERAP